MGGRMGGRMGSSVSACGWGVQRWRIYLVAVEDLPGRHPTEDTHTFGQVPYEVARALRGRASLTRWREPYEVGRAVQGEASPTR